MSKSFRHTKRSFNERWWKRYRRHLERRHILRD